MRKPVGWSVLAALAAALLFVPTVAAKDGDVRVAGTCSASSTSKLKLGREDAGVEVEFEVDQNVVGDTWAVRILQDGERIFAGRRTTQAPSGSFEVRRLTSNNAGTDNFVGRAQNLSTGEVCRGTLNF